MIAIIGGSGLTQLANLEITRKQIVRTPYGEPSGPLTFGQIGSHPVVFLARHGYGHTLAPHEINYRANLWALHAKGVTRVIAVCTVWSTTITVSSLVVGPAAGRSATDGSSTRAPPSRSATTDRPPARFAERMTTVP